jgi:hypothetical protein
VRRVAHSLPALPPEIEGKVDIEVIRERFEGNTGAYLSDEEPFDSGSVKTKHERVTDDLLEAHLRGELRIGLFGFIDGSDRCKYAGWDIDTGNLRHLHAICRLLRQLRVRYYVETSKRRGWHVWIFCDAITASKLRRFGLWVIQASKMEGKVREFFPKQENPGSTGNCMWLPFFGIRSSSSNGRGRFIDDTGMVLDQETTLKDARPLNESELDELLEQCDIPEQENSDLVVAEICLDRIPNSLPVRFVKQLERDEKLRDGWQEDRKPRSDHSRSGWDAMMAAMLVFRGYSDVEIARILLEYPMGKGGDNDATDQYLQRTISRALDWCSQHHQKEKKDVESETKEKDSTDSQADRLVALALEGCELFCDTTQNPYARVNINGHYEIRRCRGQAYKRWLCRRMYETEGKAPGSEALNSALNVIESCAVFDGESFELSNRTASHDGAIVYDMTDDKWGAQRITTSGWEEEPNPPILFTRYSHQRPQVDPVRGGDLKRVLDFIAVPDENSKLLLLVFLVAALIPDIPHPILVLHGPQGSGKSSCFRVLRKLIDPSATEVQSFPRDGNELIQMLSHHWCAFFDNVTSLPVRLSDALCRAVTGEGGSKRQLYTDDEDFIYSFRRVIALNGINVVAVRADLLDRSILIGLARIAPDQRRTESELWKVFEDARPHIFGGMLDVLSKAMSLVDSIRLTKLPRMADFARWGCAISEALGYGPDAFLLAYEENVEKQNEEVLQGHPVAAAVMALMDRNGEWEGTPSELLRKLEEEAEAQKIDIRDKLWPKSPVWMTRRLNEVVTNLADVGVLVEDNRAAKNRKISLRRDMGDTVITVTTVTDTEKQRVTNDSSSDSIPEAAVLPASRNHNENKGDDGNDTSDSKTLLAQEELDLFEGRI